MRFLILDTYYPEPIQAVYEASPDLEEAPYAQQLEAIMGLGFGRADFLVKALRAAGHAAEQVLANVGRLQRRWAHEHGLDLHESPVRRVIGRARRAIHRLQPKPAFPGLRADWELRLVAAQVESFAPDVILNCDLLQFPSSFVRGLKRRGRVIGECAYPLPDAVDLAPYDLIVSSGQSWVDSFRKRGAHAELWRHAFEPGILARLPPAARRTGVVFVGSLTAAHQGRIRFLESLVRKVPILCYGAGGDSLPPDSPLRGAVHPPLWGYAMYRRLHEAEIAVNFHIDIADCANNLRLYETTGVGTLLLTDWKSDLPEIFEPGREVATYRTADECAEALAHYLKNPAERSAIAAAGQRRTLSSHSYSRRVAELVEIIERAPPPRRDS